MKIEKVEKLVGNLHDKRGYFFFEKFKASIKSWISFEKRIVLFSSVKKFH